MSLEEHAHHMHVRRDRSQVIIRQFVHHISSAEDVLDLPRLQKCLEFFGQVSLAVRDVEVTDDQHKNLPMDGEGQGKDEELTIFRMATWGVRELQSPQRQRLLRRVRAFVVALRTHHDKSPRAGTSL